MKENLIILISLVIISCQQGGSDGNSEWDPDDNSDWSSDSSSSSRSSEEEDSIEGRREQNQKETTDAETHGEESTGGDTESSSETKETGGEEPDSVSSSGSSESTVTEHTGDSDTDDSQLDSASEKESDSSLDSDPPKDTDTVNPAICMDETTFVPKTCCNCPNDIEFPLCTDFCTEQTDSETTDNTDSDTGSGVIKECPEPYITRCDDTKEKVIECQAIWDAELYDHHFKWVEIKTCQAEYSCYPSKTETDRSNCYRDEPSSDTDCSDIREGTEKCVDGYNVDWVIRCMSDVWTVIDECEIRCLEFDIYEYPTALCGY